MPERMVLMPTAGGSIGCGEATSKKQEVKLKAYCPLSSTTHTHTHPTLLYIPKRKA